MRRWIGFLIAPLALVLIVFVIAPPAPLVREDDLAKARAIEKRKPMPEPIRLSAAELREMGTRPGTVSMANLPRTPQELAQLKEALKLQEVALLKRRAITPASDRDAMQLLVEEIAHYNDELQRFEKAQEELNAGR